LTLANISPGSPFSPNVVKINLRTQRISLLSYPDFEQSPFPELAASWSFDGDRAKPPLYRTYDDSSNPPILHRKELLVQECHPDRLAWIEITKNAEQLGLFDNSHAIGFRLNWNRLIEAKGYRLVGGVFQPIGNDVESDAKPYSASPDAAIYRHLTALSRTALSAPVQLLLRNRLLSPGTTFFDYGCGRGGDISALAADGFVAQGWDPYYAADAPLVSADVVNLGFVINVIEDTAERVEAIQKAFSLTHGVMSVGVMLHGVDRPGLPFRDGFMTSRSTFQKYFSQVELKDYLEQVLHQEAFLIGTGVAFVFADKDLEQRFNAERYRRKGVSTVLLERVRYSRPRVNNPREHRLPRPTKIEKDLATHRVLLDALWVTSLELGRWPEREESPSPEQVEESIGSLPKAIRILRDHYDTTLLETARLTRSDDLRVYFASQQFSRRLAYRKLEARLQTDIKEFFGSYAAADSAGRQLLLDAADPVRMLAACQEAAIQGLGWLEGTHTLQLHISLIDRLPAVLRAYVASGLILWNATSDVQLIKIHIESGKLTLMEFDDFDSSPLPLLRKRVKVNLRRLDYDVFEYGTAEHPQPLLYRKSRFLNEDCSGYAEQLIFDEAVEATGVLDASEFGPAPNDLEQLLKERRLAVVGMRLVPSNTIPDLDQRCGRTLTYRSFVECGATQHRLGISNLPLNPATYNAIYNLATQILDPVIDYFGSVVLTYGFCSKELASHITKRVAHKLDQHASCEMGRSGKLICDREGAACDFIVNDEDMFEVAKWIAANLPFDRLYVYGRTQPIHVSFGPENSRGTFHMVEGTGGLRPRAIDLQLN
jgi:DNA phosphorothioation-associated putative methyltransferase